MDIHVVSIVHTSVNHRRERRGNLQLEVMLSEDSDYNYCTVFVVLFLNITGLEHWNRGRIDGLNSNGYLASGLNQNIHLLSTGTYATLILL